MATIKPEDRTTEVGLAECPKVEVRVGAKVWTADGYRVTITHISATGQIAYSMKSTSVYGGSLAHELPDYSGARGFTTNPQECVERQLRMIEARRRDIERAEGYLADEQKKLAKIQARIDQEVIRQEVAS